MLNLLESRRTGVSLGRRRISLAAILMSLLSTAAAAHDYRIERVDGALILFQGHLYSAHRGEEKLTYDPGIVKAVKCLESSGRLHALALPADYPARFRSDCAALWIETSSGYWAQTLTGAVNKPRDQVSAALRSWLSRESIKLLQVWSPTLNSPIGEGLELLPQENPLRLRRGDKLRVRVVWRGQAKAGVTVAYDGSARGVTDAQGEINIRLRRAGTQSISTSFDELSSDAKADKVVHATILQFDISE